MSSSRGVHYRTVASYEMEGQVHNKVMLRYNETLPTAQQEKVNFAEADAAYAAVAIVDATRSCQYIKRQFD